MEDCEDEYSKIKASARSSSPIKSTAVVKYSSVQWPVEYARLKCNTDLNMPPSNWLSSAADSYGLRQVYTHSSGFSSFRMAHMFPDCVGEVDVVSGAECIKALLKLPYHPNGPISMMVHRVENTLLLDNFDIFHYLMKSEWAWLKNFFYEHILKSLNEKDKLVHIQSKKRLVLQRKMLLSKFLYHSLVAAPSNEQSQEKTHPQAQFRLPLIGPILPEPDVQGEARGSDFSNHTYNRNVVWTFEDIQMLIGSNMPIFGGVDRPCVSLRLCDASEPINVLTGIDYWLDNLMCNVPEVIMCYHLDGIVQKYEPIKTEDLPHMEDSKFSPKVIKNVAQNILSFLKSNATKAGHTYWLFKGSHDDVVKLYDLTSLCGGVGASDGSQNPFTIPVAMLLYRVARNMRHSSQGKHMKVLLENCIKLLSLESHPQILASSHYMLADLYVPVDTNPACPNFQTEEDQKDETEENQFFNETENEDTDVDKNCELGQLVYTGNLMLDGIGDHIESRRGEQQPKFRSKTPPPLSNCPKERARSALSHVIGGLRALHYYADSEGKYQRKKEEDEKKRTSKQKILEEMNPKMAKPFEPIPMEYEPLNCQKQEYEMANPNVAIPMPACPDSEIASVQNQNCPKSNATEHNEIPKTENIAKKKGTLIKKDKTIPKWEQSNENNDLAWKRHLKTLLYEKACLAFATLSEYYYSVESYGKALKFIVSTQKCQKLLMSEYFESRVVDSSCFLGRAGDCLFKFAKNWDKYLEVYQVEFNTSDEVSDLIMEEIKADMESEEESVFSAVEYDIVNYILEVTPPKNVEDLMTSSCLVYKQAFDVATEERKDELLRRIASVKNELGVRYMHKAQEQFNKFCKEIKEAQESDNKNEITQPEHEILSRQSFNTLMEAARIFEKVNDLPNLALLYCNIGRYMRFKAHCNLKNSSNEQKRFYSLATDYYSKARICLGNRESCPDVWDLVSWELSSALFTRACLMQDHPSDKPKVAAVVAEVLKQALKHCILTPGPRQCLYQFRAGVIYHRLGSLYHKQLRDMNEESGKRKTILSLSKLNYEQAAKIFTQLEETSTFLSVQLEYIGLMEGQVTGSIASKLKSLQNILQLLLQCESILKFISEKDLSASDAKTQNDKADSTSDGDVEMEYELLKLFEQRLQVVLKNLIQTCLHKNCASSRKDSDKLATQYKEMYSKTLHSADKFPIKEFKAYSTYLYQLVISFQKCVSDGK